jgi:hypothetical protein
LAERELRVELVHADLEQTKELQQKLLRVREGLAALDSAGARRE